jgi:hypothetical protein
VVEV